MGEGGYMGLSILFPAIPSRSHLTHFWPNETDNFTPVVRTEEIICLQNSSFVHRFLSQTPPKRSELRSRWGMTPVSWSCPRGSGSADLGRLLRPQEAEHLSPLKIAQI